MVQFLFKKYIYIYEDTNIKKNLKELMGAILWVHLEMKGVTSSRHPSAEVMAERLVRMEIGRCLPEVRKTIQSKQFQKHLEKGSKFKNSKYTKQKG